MRNVVRPQLFFMSATLSFLCANAGGWFFLLLSLGWLINTFSLLLEKAPTPEGEQQ